MVIDVSEPGARSLVDDLTALELVGWVGGWVGGWAACACLGGL